MEIGSSSPRPSLRIGLIGAGAGGSALLDLLLDWPGGIVTVVIDARQEAPGLEKARSLGIATAAHHLEVFSYPVDVVLEVTGQPAVLGDLLRVKPSGVEVIGAGSLRFFWELLARQSAVATENARLLEETARRAREHTALSAIATAMSESLHLDELLGTALDKVLEITGREKAYITLKDPATGELTLASHRGISPAFIEPLLHGRPPGGKSDQVFASGAPLVINDPGATLLKPETPREGTRAAAWIPLKAQGRVVGTLNVSTNRPVPFTPQEVDLLQAVGNVVGVALERARLYGEARDARDFLQSIAENSADAIVTTDAHGRITYWSPGAEDLFGYRAEEMVGRGAADSYRGGLEETRAIMRRLRQEGRLRNYETAIRARDGRWVEVSSSISSLCDGAGAVVGTVGVLKDITDRKRAEETAARLYQRAEERAQKLKALSALTRLISSTAASQKVFEEVANAAVTLLGARMARVWVDDPAARVIRPQPLAGLDAEAGGDTRFVDSLPYGKGLVGAAFEARAPLFVLDVQEDPRMLNQSLARAASLHSFAGLPLVAGDRTVGVLAILFCDRRQFTSEERELMNLLADHAAITMEQSRLFGELRRSYDEVRRTQEQLVESEKLRALGEMARGVAHDFNNLLAVILGRAELLRARVSEPEILRSLEAIREAAHDGAKTVRRIQEFTRTRRTREFERVDLGQILKEVVELTCPRWKDEAQSGGVFYDVQVEAEAVPPVAGRSEELREVFTNLLINALEAMPSGGRFIFRLRADAREVIVEAEDTGHGMPESTRRRVFEPFFTTKGPRGTGLGLSVAWGIVSRHGGRIEAQSAPGVGSIFTVHLPVGPALPETVEPDPVLRPPRGTRVLVIEDEAAVRGVLREMLSREGYAVLEATNGMEGLARCEAEPVDLVLSDISMPGMSGWNVAETCRQRFPRLPVGFITGWGDRLDQAELDRHGVRFVLAKPFEADDVLRHMARALRRTRLAER